MIQITARGNSAQCTRAERLTSGMVGLQCKFEFDSAWDGLTKTAVFSAGNEQRNVLLTANTCSVPWEVLKTAGYQLYIGVYGTNADGTLVIPTAYANCGIIATGADPNGEEGEDPTPTLVEQIMAAAGVAVTTANEVKAAADAGDFKGDKGETGAAFTYDQFTPTQLAALKGDKGDKGDTGDKGEKGDPFTYDDFTPEQLESLRGPQGAGVNLVDTFDPVGGTIGGAKREGKAIRILNNAADTYFHIKLSERLKSGVTYTLSFDAVGVEEGKEPTFVIGRSSWGGRVTIKNGKNIVQFTPNGDATGEILVDDVGTRPMGVSVLLSNFQIEEGTVATRNVPSIGAIEEYVERNREKLGGIRTYRQNIGGCTTTVGNSFSHWRNQSFDSIPVETIENGVSMSEVCYAMLPAPSDYVSAAGSCDINGQYICNINFDRVGDVAIGCRYRIAQPGTHDQITSNCRMIANGTIATPPTAPTIAYNAGGASEAIAIAESYVAAQEGGRIFKYGENFFYNGVDTINDANGAAMMECDTYVGMVLRGIPYDRSPFATLTPNHTCSYDTMMESANPLGYDWCDRLLQKITGEMARNYWGSDLKSGSAVAWMCWGTEGSVFSDISHVRSGDLAIWKRPESSNAFDNIGHIAMLGVENGEIYVYEVTGLAESRGKILHKVKLSDKEEQPAYFARIDFS